MWPRLFLFNSALLLVGVPAWSDSFKDIEILPNYMFSGNTRDGIPAMTNPDFVRPEDITFVAEDDLILGVFLNGEARAYPENLGWRHEIINDRIGDQFISVTLCPLTGTGLVFDATDEDGDQIEFGVSGLLINNNLVMYDRRDNETLYPQMIFTGISGTYAGETLELLPVVETTWAMWKQLYPDTRVAQVGTGLERYSADKRARYTNPKTFEFYPYYDAEQGDYRTNHDLLYYPLVDARAVDRTFMNKDVVLGLCLEGELKAYPFLEMPDRAVINDIVGEQPVVVVFDSGSQTAIPYHREVQGQWLSFYEVEAEDPWPVEFMDLETGSRWTVLGEAISGPLAGLRLQQIPAYNSMWFAWAAYWPDTHIWRGKGIIDTPMTAVEESRQPVPEQFALRQNFPNPFNPSTSIQYSVPQDGMVVLKIFDGLGQEVRTLVDQWRADGTYVEKWDGRDANGVPTASGNYLYRVEMPGTGTALSRTMTLVR